MADEHINQEIADHVARLRERLEAGRLEIDRQRRAAAETRRHIDGVRNWLEATERELGRERHGRAE